MPTIIRKTVKTNTRYGGKFTPLPTKQCCIHTNVDQGQATICLTNINPLCPKSALVFYSQANARVFYSD